MKQQLTANSVFLMTLLLEGNHRFAPRLIITVSKIGIAGG